MSNAVLPFPASWRWRLFYAEELPEYDPETIAIGEVAALPDGRRVEGRAFAWPDGGGMVPLGPLLTPLPPVRGRAWLVADFETEAEMRRTLGVGADWWMALHLDGRLICDTRQVANGENIVSPWNHAVALECAAGRHQLVFEAMRGGQEFCVAAAFLDLPSPQLRYAPWVCCPDAATGAMTIGFSTEHPCPAGVDLRQAGETAWRRVNDNLGGEIRRDRSIHSIRLRRLEPDCEYEYRVVLLDEGRGFAEAAPPEGRGRFRTAPVSARPFTFVATSDVQVKPPERLEFLRRLADSPAGRQAEFFAFLGDVSWTTDFDRNYMDGMFMPLRGLTKDRLTLVPVRGNHEIYGRDSNRFFEYFAAPAPGQGAYWLFRYGEVCFLCLDFCDDHGPRPAPSHRALHDIEPYIAEEAEWLREAVELPQCRGAKYRVVLAHGVPVGDPCEYMPAHVRQVVDPVFAGPNPRCRIHLWLGGHVHFPQRSIPGERAVRAWQHPAEFYKGRYEIHYHGEDYHFPVVVMAGPLAKNPPELQLSSLAVTVDENGITVAQHDRDGQEFDRFRVGADGAVAELGGAPWFQIQRY